MSSVIMERMSELINGSWLEKSMAGETCSTHCLQSWTENPDGSGTRRKVLMNR